MDDALIQRIQALLVEVEAVRARLARAERALAAWPASWERFAEGLDHLQWETPIATPRDAAPLAELEHRVARVERRRDEP